MYRFKKHIKHIIFLAVLLVSPNYLGAQDTETPKKIKKARTEYLKTVTRAEQDFNKIKRSAIETYISKLRKAQKSYAKKDDLVQAMTCKTEADKFEALVKDERMANVSLPLKSKANARLKILDGKFAEGLLIFQYARHMKQMDDHMVYLSERELGNPKSTLMAQLQDPFEVPVAADMNIIAKGFLKIDQAGQYGFIVYGHHTGQAVLTVGQNRIEQTQTKNGSTVTFIDLKKGMIPITVEGRIGNRKVTLKWVTAKDSGLIPIPQNRFYYSIREALEIPFESVASQ